jgi:hypothetical protein
MPRGALKLPATQLNKASLRSGWSRGATVGSSAAVGSADLDLPRRGDSHHCSSSEFAFDRESAAMTVDDVLHKRKAQSGQGDCT